MKLHGAFVGINSYEDRRIAPLNFARADAERLHTAFESGLSKSETNLSVLVDKQATKQNIFELIGERIPRRTTSKDVVLLYFAGHGTPETDGSIDRVSRYIVTHDTKYDYIFASGIDMEVELNRLIRRISAGVIVVMLDTCFSGQAGGRTFEGPILAKHRAKSRAAVKLSNLDLGEGRIILSASDSNEVAREDVTLGHGVFTFFILQTLTDYSSNSITITTLYESVAKRVSEFTRGRQHPIINGRSNMAQLPVPSASTLE
jgi:uncharacterized caspase-like protein